MLLKGDEQLRRLLGMAQRISDGFLENGVEVLAQQRLYGAAAHEPHATIGITVYPPYPAKEFPNMAPYKYQNTGDWTWFGGRFIQALTKYGLVAEAYAELNPMIERTLANKGFHEWYDVRTGAPKGSGEFRGEASVLLEAIAVLRSWARANQ